MSQQSRNKDVQQGQLLWEPTPDTIGRSRIGAYVGWLEAERGLKFADREALWHWSIDDQEAFWRSIWDYFEVRASAQPERVLGDATMPGSQWFPGARLNYAEQIFRWDDDSRVAVHGYSQTRDTVRLTQGELRAQVSRAREVLRGLGVGPGDRVVAYVPNIPEAVVAFLRPPRWVRCGRPARSSSAPVRCWTASGR